MFMPMLTARDMIPFALLVLMHALTTIPSACGYAGYACAVGICTSVMYMPVLSEIQA